MKVKIKNPFKRQRVKIKELTKELSETLRSRSNGSALVKTNGGVVRMSELVNELSEIESKAKEDFKTCKYFVELQQHFISFFINDYALQIESKIPFLIEFDDLLCQTFYLDNDELELDAGKLVIPEKEIVEEVEEETKKIESVSAKELVVGDKSPLDFLQGDNDE